MVLEDRSPAGSPKQAGILWAEPRRAAGRGISRDAGGAGRGRQSGAAAAATPCPPTRVDVGVIDGRHEFNLGRFEGVPAPSSSRKALAEA